MDLKKSLNFDEKSLKKIDLSPFGVPQSNFYIYLDYLNHPLLSGNKLRKLYGLINHIEINKLKSILTVGGNFSNYLFAIAQLPKILPLDIQVIIKGYEPKVVGNTIQELLSNGIAIDYLSKQVWKENKEKIIKDYLLENPQGIFVEEGGKSAWDAKGFEPLISNQFKSFDTICVSVGTGATYDAIQKFAFPKVDVHGFVASNDESLKAPNRTLFFEGNRGGFAKIDSDLIDFSNEFYKKTGILLDPIYTSKMMMQIIQFYKNQFYTPNKSIVAIHTGGLQGWHGMAMRFPENKVIEEILNYI